MKARFFCADVIQNEANSSRKCKVTVSVIRTSLYYFQSWKQLHFTLKSSHSNDHVIQKLLTISNALSNLTWMSFFERLIMEKCQINHVLEWEIVTTPNSSYVYFRFNPFSSNCVFLFDFIGSVFFKNYEFSKSCWTDRKLTCVNPYWQISGKFLRPFYWKTHPIVN